MIKKIENTKIIITEYKATFVWSLKTSLKLISWCHMTDLSIFYQRIRSKENDIVSANEAIIETHVPTELYYNYSKRIIEELQ